jgi:hypothetical protein
MKEPGSCRCIAAWVMTVADSQQQLLHDTFCIPLLIAPKRKQCIHGYRWWV